MKSTIYEYTAFAFMLFLAWAIYDAVTSSATLNSLLVLILAALCFGLVLLIAAIRDAQNAVCNELEDLQAAVDRDSTY